MTGIPDLILRLTNAASAEELAQSLHELGLVDIHHLKYLLIYQYYLQMRKEGENVVGAVMETAIEFNISVRQVYKIKKIMESKAQTESIVQ